MLGPRVSVAASMLGLALAGCAADGPNTAGLAGSPQQLLRLATHEGVLVRGWIREGAVGLEPVMVTEYKQSKEARGSWVPWRIPVNGLAVSPGWAARTSAEVGPSVSEHRPKGPKPQLAKYLTR